MAVRLVTPSPPWYIARTEGNLSEAARLLGTKRNRIYRALAQEERRGK